jgi:hypothetical protein
MPDRRAPPELSGYSYHGRRVLFNWVVENFTIVWTGQARLGVEE